MNLFVKAFILTTLVFVCGIAVGIWIGDQRINELEQTTLSLQNNIYEAELQLLLMDSLSTNATCNYLIKTAEGIGSEAAELGKLVERSENAQKINTDTFKSLKSTYTVTLIKDWLTLEKIKNSCNGTYATVLYFYSNNNCDNCENQGIILSHLKQKMGNELMVFAIDTDLDIGIVNTLKDIYEITAYPTLVLNGKKIGNYIELDAMEEQLCEGNSNLNIC